MSLPPHRPIIYDCYTHCPAGWISCSIKNTRCHSDTTLNILGVAYCRLLLCLNSNHSCLSIACRGVCAVANPECARGGGVNHILAEKRGVNFTFSLKMHENVCAQIMCQNTGVKSASCNPKRKQEVTEEQKFERKGGTWSFSPVAKWHFVTQGCFAVWTMFMIDFGSTGWPEQESAGCTLSAIF